MATPLGFKTFATGDVLTAADTNGYLMQGVWVFADAAARTAAVTSPQEGNMSYLKDTNSTEYYSGSAWVAVGGSSNNFYAGKNRVINGAMDIAQRGTSISVSASSSPFTLDRWRVAVNANQASTVSQQSASDANLPNIRYCMRYQRNSGQTGVGTIYMMQYGETANCVPLAGKTITISFYARAGANYSAASNALSLSVITGTGTDQSPWAGYTGQSTLLTTTATLTTSWQRFTATATMPTNMTEFGYWFTYTPVGTAGAADYYEITGVQVEAGSTATDFQTASGSIGGELALCQRYYQVITGGLVTATNSTTRVAFAATFPPMRTTTPTFSLTGALVITDLFTGNFTQSTSEITTNTNNGNNSATLSFNNFSGLTAYRGYQITASQQILASAEL